MEPLYFTVTGTNVDRNRITSSRDNSHVAIILVKGPFGHLLSYISWIPWTNDI